MVCLPVSQAVGATVMSVLVLLRFVDLFSVVQTQAEQLAALARTDALTGLANRRTWDHELSRACRAAREQHRRLAVAILDIDHFTPLEPPVELDPVALRGKFEGLYLSLRKVFEAAATPHAFEIWGREE